MVPSLDSVWDWGLLLDTELLWPVGIFAQFPFVCPLLPFLDRDSYLSYLLIVLLQYVALENHLEVSVGLEYSVADSYGHYLSFCYLVWHPLFCYLGWYPIRFRLQFKMLIITYKVLHAIRLDYLQDCLVPKHICHIFQQIPGPLLEQCHLKGPKSHVFSVMTLSFWNIQLTLILQTFRKTIKIWLFPRAFGSW